MHLVSFATNKWYMHAGQGSEPQWNESFVFTVNDGASELNLKIMDKDTFTKDDFVGEAT